MTSVSIDLTPEQLREITGPVLSPLIDNLIADAEQRLVELREIRDQINFGVPANEVLPPAEEPEAEPDEEPAPAPSQAEAQPTTPARKPSPPVGVRGRTRAGILAYVTEHGPATQRQLADHLGHADVSTVCQAVKRMTKAGELVHVAGTPKSSTDPARYGFPAGAEPRGPEPVAPAPDPAERQEPSPEVPSLHAELDGVGRVQDEIRRAHVATADEMEEIAGDEAKRRVLEVLRRDPLTIGQIVTATNVSRDEAKRCIRELKNEGNIIQVVGTADYRAVTPNGAAA